MQDAPSSEVDFFISRRGASAAVAQEVADVLVETGYTVIVQDFDISYSANFLAAMHDALKRARHLIVLLTRDYDQSDFTLAEVTNFLAAAARAGGERRLVVLRVDDCEPAGLLAGIVYADLVGVADPRERKARILAAAEGRSMAQPRRPKLFENVPPRDLNFTGRDERLAELHKLLMDADKPAAITQAAIHGLGGIGKTSLAAEYAHRYASDHAGVWWAPAEQRTLLIASLAALAGRLEPRLIDEPDQERAAKAGLARLARLAMPFLLVYDNVEAPDTLRDLVPSAGARVLVTTRYPDWGGQAVEVKLDVLGAEAAAELLQTRTGRTDGTGAARLADALGRLPLALDHAGAFCRLTATGFDAYRNRIGERIARAPKGAAYPASIAATFGLAIEKAAAEHQAAEVLLGFFAFLAPEKIPLDLVNDDVAQADDRAEALMALAAVSLIEHDVLDDGAPAVTLHRLVQAAMRARLAGRGDTAAVVERTTRRLAEAFPGSGYSDPEVWPRGAVLLPHVLALREQALAIGEASASVGDLLDNTGSYLHGRAAYVDAEPLLREAFAIGEKTLGREHADVAARLVSLANLLRATGRYAESEPLLREAIAIEEKIIGREHPTFAASLNNLALLLDDTGRYVEAEQLYREALAISEKTRGHEHPEVATRLNNLGTLLWQTGRHAEAEALLREVIAIEEKTIGRAHPSFATSLNNLATLLQMTGRYAEAEPPLREAIAISEKTIGRDHPDVAPRLNNLARVLRLTDRHEEAEQLAREAIAIWRKTVGSEHPLIGRGHENLAQILLKTGRRDDALVEARGALAVHEKALGAEHNWTKDSARTCADALGRTEEAAALRARYGLTPPAVQDTNPPAAKP
jgi:tetratricopeptide (TPR) repeat protein